MLKIETRVNVTVAMQCDASEHHHYDPTIWSALFHSYDRMDVYDSPLISKEEEEKKKPPRWSTDSSHPLPWHFARS